MPVLSDSSRLVAELRRSALLSNPRRLCEKLGLLDGAQRQSGDGVIIRCPAHRERNPSCSVTRGPDGTTRCRCFSCDWTGDALSLIGIATGRTAFSEIVDDACDLVGMPRPGESKPSGFLRAEPRMTKEPSFESSTDQHSYPEDAEALWGDLEPVLMSPIACSMLKGRSIDPGSVASHDLARVILDQRLPRWASYQGDPWSVTGHVLVLPVFDADGNLRSVRGWRVIPGDSPKRLPPGGHKATGLVLANHAALSVLRGKSGPCRVVVVEGEPDFLTLATRIDGAVFGVLSGAWTDEHAAKVPLGSTVVIRTHVDKAGDKYAEHVAKTLRGRGQVRRLVA